MPSLDVFSGDAFSMRSLTSAINRMSYQPSILGSMGVFSSKGLRTTTMDIERKAGKISLLPSKERGSRGTAKDRNTRSVRGIKVPHIPHDTEILAESIQNIRAFASENELESVAQVVNEELAEMRQNHETTLEWFRVGAIKGEVLDGDGTTSLLNLFTEFNVTQKTVDFVLGTATTKMKPKCMEVARHIEDQLGGLTYTGIQAVCGNDFWDSFTTHADVEAAFDRWNEGEFLRDTMRHQPNSGKGFSFAGINWINYRGKVGSSSFIPDGDCRFFPLGIRDLFAERFAPADFIETVNTVGKPVYATQERLKHNKGVEIHTQSNPMTICTLPEVLVRGHTSN